MITESDVRAVLAEQAHDISEPDDILNRLTVRRPAGRRRWIAPVAAAAAVAAVVAGGVMLAGTNHKPAHQAHKTIQPTVEHTFPPMGGIEFQYVGSIGRVPHYKFGDPAFFTGQQLTEIDGFGVTEIGDVTLYTEGAFDPSTITHAQPVSIGAIHAQFGTVMVHLTNAPKPSSNYVVPTPTLAWQLGSGRWIAITGWRPSELAAHHLQLDALTETKKIAAAIDTSVTRPFLVPLRVGYLPAGLHRDGAEYSLPTKLHTVFVKFRSAPGRGSDAVTIAAHPSQGTKHPVGTFDLNGHLAWIKPSEMLDGTVHPPKVISKTLDLNIDFGQSVVTISSTHDSRSELIKIGRSVTVADINDPSTWFDASK